MFRILAIIVVFLFLSCSEIIVSETSGKPQKPVELLSLNLDFEPVKACYSHIDTLVYVADKKHQIHIYSKNQKKTIIGGLGTGQNALSDVSDIASGYDGTLWILDSINRKLVKFSKDGNFISETKLDVLSKPVLFDLAVNEKIYIYDDYKREIFVLNPLNSVWEFSFGKMQFEEPVSLTCNRDFIIIQERNGSTLIYNTLGNFIEELKQSTHIDKFGNKYSITNNTMKFGDMIMMSSIYPINGVKLRGDFLTFISNSSEIKVMKMSYEKKSE